MKYNPALDGIRALAVLAVVLHHAAVPFAIGGSVGVDVFFVLSGYLITRTLADHPDLTRFYIRRARRLVPALAFMLAAFLLAAPHFLVNAHPVRDAALAFFYLSDYGLAFWHRPDTLAHTWSLAVEEHFYLLWPLVFLWFRPSWKVLLAAYLSITAWRWQCPEWEQAYYRFDMHMSGLILGCALAALPRWKMPAWPGLVLLSGLFLMLIPGEPFTQGPGIMLAELATALLIMGRQPQWLSAAPLTYIGRISYGIYLWHYPVAAFVVRVYDWPMALLVTLAISVPMAALSYHTVEAWFRKPQAGGAGQSIVEGNPA